MTRRRFLELAGAGTAAVAMVSTPLGARATTKDTAPNRILITNADYVVVSENRIIENGAVFIANGDIVDVGESQRLKREHRADQVIDATRCAVMPGLVDTHTHLAAGHLAGLDPSLLFQTPVPEPGPKYPMLIRLKAAGLLGAAPSLERFERIWLAMDWANAERTYDMSMAALLQLIKHGTTTYTESWPFPDALASAATDSGMRAVICPHIAALSHVMPDAPGGHDDSLALTKAAVLRWHGAANGRISIRVHPDCVFASANPSRWDPDLISKCVALAREHDVGLATHMAVTDDEVALIKHETGKTPIGLAHDLGVLGPQTLLIHTYKATEQDIELVLETDTRVARCPVGSELSHATEITSVPALHKSGVKFGFGTDFPTTMDIFEVMGFTQRLYGRRFGLTTQEVFGMATHDSARALNLENKIGSLDKGKKADLIVVDLADPSSDSLMGDQILKQLVLYTRGRSVKTSIIDGKIVMQDRKVQTMDAQRVMDKAHAHIEDFNAAFRRQIAAG